MQNRDIDNLQRILRNAGQEIEKVKSLGAVNVQHKADQSLVTTADIASEKIILKMIGELYPEDAILSEEAGVSQQAPDGHSERYMWVIDPLDGTTNFANNYPFYCVSVARVRYTNDKSEVLLGGVYDPVRDKMYLAEKGGGAFCNGHRIHVRDSRSLQEAFLVTGFAYFHGKDLEEEVSRFKRVALKCQSVRRDGAAALDLAMVAEGIYDGYWEKGLQSWDVAAGALLVEEAGGVVVRYDGSAFCLQDPELSIVCGSRDIVNAIVSEIGTNTYSK